MRQKIVFIALVATMFCSATAYAQKVVTEGSGETIKVIIDATGLPSGAVTTTKKPLATTATSSKACTQDATDLASKINNEKVYQRFEVDKTDSWSSTATWLDALNHCKNNPFNNTAGWRLPTQRELMLIWVLHSQLNKLLSFTPFGGGYWSSSENNSSSSWSVGFGNGATVNTGKAKGNRVRCVRDI